MSVRASTLMQSATPNLSCKLLCFKVYLSKFKMPERCPFLGQCQQLIIGFNV